MTVESPRVSIVIPARNEAGHLGNCLDALERQVYPRERSEVIVVDNGSTDCTPQLARDRGCRVLTSQSTTVAGARNEGARSATGEVLAFIDADCVAASDWLRCGVQSLCAEPCVTGSDVLAPEDSGWVARNWTLFLPGRRKVACINSGNLLCSAALFRELGGFDERLHTGEDCELCQRASRRVAIVADASIRVVHLGVPRSVSEFLRREVWHGLGAFGTARRDWRDKPLLGTLAFMALTASQIAALVAGSAAGFAAASVGVIALCSTAVVFRRRFLRGVQHALALGVLHYLYFLGRSFSLVLLLLPRRFRAYGIKRHGARSEHRATPGT